MVEIAASTAEDTDSYTLTWVSVSDSESEPLRRFRDAAYQIIGVTETDSTTQKGTSEGADKAAGESTLPTNELTGLASLGRLVCTPGQMTLAIISQTVDLNLREYEAMLIAQTKKRLNERRRQLHLETLEPRQLLASISGTVFGDLDADGVRDTGEPGLEGWTVTLEPAGETELTATILNPTPAMEDQFGHAVDIFNDGQPVYRRRCAW